MSEPETVFSQAEYDALNKGFEMLAENVRLLLLACATKGNCKGCGVEIWWMKTKNGRNAPYTVRGLNHFADCPKANDFKRK